MFFRNKFGRYVKLYLALSIIIVSEVTGLINISRAAEEQVEKKVNKELKTYNALEVEKKVNTIVEEQAKIKALTPEAGDLKKQIIQQESSELKNTSPEKKAIEEQNIEKVEKKEEIKEIKNSTEGNIYPWLPSMTNIFKGQMAQGSQDLKPFGYELFNKDSSVFSPMYDAPIGSDYIIGPGDNLQINIWGSVNTALDITVDRDGKIILPEVGTFIVGGRSFGSLKEQLKQKLNEIFNNVSVDVSLGKLRKIKVYVVGETLNPGAYDITSVTTLFNVIFMAGGPTAIGSLRNIDIIRNNRVIKKIDLYNFILRGDKSGDIKLENGDTVYFNLKGKTVGIQGLVNRPAIYELKNESKLTEILNLAGGTVPTSYLKNVQVKRVEANKEIILLNVDLTVKDKLTKFLVKDKDIINIFPILPVDKKTIYLNGHVFRPGTYEYSNKMKLSDIIKSYSELLPEPYTEYAQIIRLQEPDLKPVSIMFNLGDVLSKKTNVELKPFDTILIYSKWDFTRVPEIVIAGEVFKPGAYKIVKGARVMDALSFAGGVTKDTYLDRVEIIRKIDIYGNKINMSVSLKEVMKNNSQNNIELKDEDIIIVHSNKEIFQEKFVTIAGEVTKPSRYLLGKGMRISDLINLGGNLTKAAYTQDAELVRYIVDGKDIKFQVIKLDLQKVMKGDSSQNILLMDLDRLLIKQIPRWDEIGKTITLQGSVKYPGVYAVSPEDKLSDVIARAGGFLPEAYLKGAKFYRENIKEIQREQLHKLIADTEQIVLSENTEDINSPTLSKEELVLREKKFAYRNQLLSNLKKTEVTGRLVLDITSLDKLRNSPSDVIIKPGDVLVIPKIPASISVQGEVYNQNALLYNEGKTVDYYLSNAGGPTPDADISRIHVVKANGRVISGEGKWFYDIKNLVLERGDSILVPQLTQKNDYIAVIKDLVDIAYKTSVAAGVFIQIRK